MSNQPTDADVLRMMTATPAHAKENAGQIAILKAVMAGERDPAKLRAAARAAKAA